MLRLKTKEFWVGFAIFAVMTSADLWSKDWALENLSQERTEDQPPLCHFDEEGRLHTQRLRTQPVVLIEGYLEFQYAENCGAAFGMLSQAPPKLRSLIFGITGILAVVILLGLVRQGRGGRLFRIAVPLVLSGAVGNFADRLRLGYVVDFIRFHIQDSFEWPTFNVADIAISIAVGLFLLDGMLQSKQSAATSDKPAVSGETS